MNKENSNRVRAGGWQKPADQRYTFTNSGVLMLDAASQTRQNRELMNEVKQPRMVFVLLCQPQIENVLLLDSTRLCYTLIFRCVLLYVYYIVEINLLCITQFAGRL